MGDLTKNFSRKEFACPCCHLDIISTALVNRLQVIRDILDCPLIIHSGFRCESHHREIYKKLGKPPPMNSLHLSGQAADWSVDDLDKFMQAGKLLRNWSGGYHQYETFFHCDVGRKRRW